MLNGTAGTWRRWSERGASPQHRTVLLSHSSQAHRAEQSSGGCKLWQGLSWWSSTGSKAWPGMQYPTVLNALIQQPGDSRNSHFSHFRGKVWICSCSGSHPMTHLTSNCMFRCLNSHFSQEGTDCHDVGGHQQHGQTPPWDTVCPWATVYLKTAKTVTGGQQKQLSKEGENNLPLTGSVQRTGLQMESFGVQTRELTQGK